MTPRRFINFFKSPTGALTLFLLGLLVLLILVNSRRSSQHVVSLVPPNLFGKNRAAAAQVPSTIRREMVPFNPQSVAEKTQPTQTPAAKPDTTPSLPLISVTAENPALATREPKKFSDDFAPFGRLIPCELVITVDSSSIQTPIIGLVTEDIFHHGQLIIPARTEVHGTAQVDRARERIASNGRWTLVWQNGQELECNRPGARSRSRSGHRHMGNH